MDPFPRKLDYGRGQTSRWLSKERLAGLDRMENGVEKDYIVGDDEG